ncbi:MAG TPA: tetratricopeptide repeat protein [Rhizomicrobium sp.]|jgi:TPR repeat protein
MAQSELQSHDDTRERLLEAARALVLRGDNKFSVSAVCAEAGVDRMTFRNCFPGRTALMAALMQEVPTPKEDLAAAIEAVSVTPSQVPEPVVASMPDAWLERRLRVFERALNTLEEKAETRAREQARVIVQLEERLSLLEGKPVFAPTVPAPMPEPAKEVLVRTPELRIEKPSQVPEPEKTQASLMLSVEPQTPAVSKEQMAEVLQAAREAARAAAVPDEQPKKRFFANLRLRWLAIGGSSLVALFICVGLMLGDTARATQTAGEGMGEDGTAHRHVAANALQRTIARADAGDIRAQTLLALSYVRGEGLPADATAAVRWSAAAAHAGQPVAQYLLGALYARGDGVKVDPKRAFRYFSTAAAKGNLKAMHNLGIAYAQGIGTARNDAKAAKWFTLAAERGYVDSAFDLAVMYERGLGVAQNLKQAMKWYAVAGQAGDKPSRARVEFLRGQMNAADAHLASNTAQNFAPLPAIAAANALPSF